MTKNNKLPKKETRKLGSFGAKLPLRKPAPNTETGTDGTTYMTVTYTTTHIF